ncbi:MAG: Iron-sulfur cluster assembly protein IscA [uncultured bacterium]|nr:MAG: Iron-sulfur cluster assembly protein IscA [uncultured bacterium]
MDINMTFTSAACDYIEKIIAKQRGKGLRLSIKKTGCSGFSYAPSIVQEINSNDLILEIKSDVRVYIDIAWLDLLDGLHVDYIAEDKSGLKQKKLIFTNPNESSRCGCGESFHIE